MSSDRTIILARFSELLESVEASAKSLRTYLESKIEEDGAETEVPYAEGIADSLSLPLHADTTIANQSSLLRISCERIAQLVTPPRHIVFEAAGSFYTSLALQIVLKHDIATLVDTAFKAGRREGVSATELSTACGLDGDLLTRVLRYLSVHGIFEEVTQGVFLNSPSSATMANNPEFKAHLDLVIHEGQLAAPYFEHFMAERFAAANANAERTAPPSAFSMFSEGQSVYKWLHSPENADRGRNFNLAMRGMGHTEGLAFLPVDYPFHLFPPSTILVDVGGGIGSLAELLLPTQPHLSFVVEDLEPVIKLASEVAGPNMKNWIEEGKVKFQTHDCFRPQPETFRGAVFVLKNMIHNYPDSQAIQMLAAIRPSNPLKILVIDRMVIPELRAGTRNISGINGNQLPSTSQGIPTMYDLVMGSLHGGRTRTVEEWRSLFTKGGFELACIHPLRASTGQAVLEGIPV